MPSHRRRGAGASARDLHTGGRGSVPLSRHNRSLAMAAKIYCFLFAMYRFYQYSIPSIQLPQFPISLRSFYLLSLHSFLHSFPLMVIPSLSLFLLYSHIDMVYYLEFMYDPQVVSRPVCSLPSLGF